MIWYKENLEQDTVRQLSKELEIDTLLSSVLVRRGRTENEGLLYFLEKSVRYLHNPFLLKEIDDAAERVLMAMDEGERILIFGDRDVDGVCATVILFHGLLKLGVLRENLQFLNSTGDAEYGLTADVAAEAAKQEISLILTVDCGCANHKEITMAYELGIDVIVLDHHTPKEDRPAAYAVVNPHSRGNQTDDSGLYPFTNICATSVVGKFLWALGYMQELRQKEIDSQRFCLIDVTVLDGQVRVYAAKLQNLCIRSRIELDIQKSEDALRLYEYFQNEVLCSFTIATTRQALAGIYGASYDIYLIDLCALLLRYSPGLAERLQKQGFLQNAPLLRSELLRLSRLARYRKMDFFDSQVELFISILNRQMSLPHELEEQSLDLMAIATIADMMPLDNENRIIVDLGLAKISRSPRTGLREILLELGLLGQNISVKELSWKVIPVLNAAGRMGNTALLTDLFSVENCEERRILARQLIQLNQERKEQSEKFFALAQQPARQSFAESKGQLIYVAFPELSRGITGLLAGRLSQQYGGVPVIAVVQNEEGDWSGSLRSSGTPSIMSLLEPLADWFINYGGHKAAGGFSIVADKQKDLWPALLKLLPLLAGESEKKDTTKHIVDAEIPLKILEPSLLDRLWFPLAPYGIDWPELLLLSCGLLLEEVRPIGRSEAGHLRLTLRKPVPRDGDIKPESQEQSLNAVFWGGAERYGKDFTKGDNVDILYHIQSNYYQGQMKFQLEIVDIRAHSVSPDSKKML